MKRSELAAKLAARFPALTRRDAARCVELLLDAIGQTLARPDGKGRVEIRDFGVFHLSYCRSRIGRNPKTGAPIDIPAKLAVRFKAGRLMKQRLENIQQGNHVHLAACDQESSLGFRVANCTSRL